MGFLLHISGLVQSNNNDAGSFSVVVPDFVAKKGEIIGVMGPSGAGKTTLLETLALMRPPTAVNNYSLNGQLKNYSLDLDDWENQPELLDSIRGEHIAYVNQQLSLLPYFTLMANINLHSELLERVDEPHTQSLLTKLGLSNFRSRYPHELSAGQRQRTIIARAIATKPELLLLDEPTSALNSEMANTALATVSDYVSSTGSACVLVSHDIALLQEVCDSIYNLTITQTDEKAGASELRKESALIP